MNAQILASFFETVNEFLNSPIGVAIMWAATMGLFGFLMSKLNPWQETWKKYEGSIISGIKLAEKNIPDDMPNKSMQKLDAALRFVLKAYAESNKGKQPPAKTVEAIRQGIQIKHAELDRFGGLKKPESNE